MAVPFLAGLLTKCKTYPEDEGNMAIQNVGILPHHYMVS
jgi:hypothetical protein